MSYKKSSKIAIIVVVLVLAGVGLALWKMHSDDAGPQTTSKEPSAQSSYKGTPRQDSQSTDQGTATDNHGDTTGDTGGGVSSASGVVTIAAPVSNTTVVSGATLKGAATGLDQVQYRVVDDNAGVIAQGSLSVVNGTYSGTLHFKATAATGQIEVYDFNASYQEENNVEIPVKF